jgi:hypothetical protein
LHLSINKLNLSEGVTSTSGGMIIAVIGCSKPVNGRRKFFAMISANAAPAELQENGLIKTLCDELGASAPGASDHGCASRLCISYDAL